MRSATYKAKSFFLAVTWLLVSTAWAPIGALAHVGDGSHAMPSSLVKTMKVSVDSECGVEGCPEAVIDLTDCDFVCESFTGNPPVVTFSTSTVDTFGAPDATFLHYPDLARLERPPSISN